MEVNETTSPQAGEAEATQVVAAQESESDMVRKLRDEAARYRTQNRELTARVAAFEAERQTEAERLAAQAKTAQEAAAQALQELRAARADAAIAKVAAKLSVDAGLLGKLVAVDFDDAGLPVNVEAAAAKVMEDYPQLKLPASGTSVTNPGRSAGSRLTMADVRKMSEAEINARWDDVQAAMKAAGGR